MASGSMKPEMTDIICETATESLLIAVAFENMSKLFKKHPLSRVKNKMKYNEKSLAVC